MRGRFALAVRIALGAGFVVDGFVGVMCIVAQPLLGPLLGVPVKDPAITAFLGGELIVAATIYALIFTDLVRWRPLLWLCALDQTLGVAIPAVQIAAGHVPATLQTLGPMPLQLVLVAIYVAGARAPEATTAAAERVSSPQRPKGMRP